MAAPVSSFKAPLHSLTPAQRQDGQTPSTPRATRVVLFSGRGSPMIASPVTTAFVNLQQGGAGSAQSAGPQTHSAKAGAKPASADARAAGDRFLSEDEDKPASGGLCLNFFWRPCFCLFWCDCIDVSISADQALPESTFRTSFRSQIVVEQAWPFRTLPRPVAARARVPASRLGGAPCLRLTA